MAWVRVGASSARSIACRSPLKFQNQQPQRKRSLSSNIASRSKSHSSSSSSSTSEFAPLSTLAVALIIAIGGAGSNHNSSEAGAQPKSNQKTPTTTTTTTTTSTSSPMTIKSSWLQQVQQLQPPNLSRLLRVEPTLCKSRSPQLPEARQQEHETGFLHPKASLRNFRTVQRLDWARTKRPLESQYTWSPDEIVGEGSYGSVHRAYNKTNGELFALKKIPKELTTDVSFQQEMRAMIYIRSKGGHPHLCRMHEHFDDDPKSYYVILDYIGGGEMFDHLIKNGAYSELDASRLVNDVASALNFLHGIGVVHADLKPENLLLTTSRRGDSVVKIADFGCAQLLEHADEDFAAEDYEPVYGAPTPAYCPPEIIEKAQPLQPSTDMWALGIILFIMLTGSHPYDLNGDATDQEIEDRILDPSYRVPIHRYTYTGHLSRSAKDLMRKLLHPDPKKRPTAYQVLQHPWVQGEGLTEKRRRSKKISRSFFDFTSGYLIYDEEETTSSATEEEEESKGEKPAPPTIRHFKTQLQDKFFEAAIHWSDEEEDEYVQRRTSLIERCFQVLDTQELIASSKDGNEEDNAKALNSMSHFSNMLSHNITHKHYVPGDVIYREGEKGHHMYFLDSGSVMVQTKDGSVAHRHQGDFFGEGALLHPQNLRSGTVSCTTPVHVLEISREYFDKYLSSSSGNSNEVLMTLKEKDSIRKRNRAKAILKLQNNMQQEEIKCNATFFNDGDQGDSMFVMESGKVDVVINDNLVFSALPGNVFGEHSLLSGRPRNCTAKCVTKEGCVALELLGKDFRQLAESSPQIKKTLRDLQLRREFKKAVVTRSHKSFPYANPEQAFQVADHKHMGELDAEAVADLLKELKEDVSKEEVQEVLDILDMTTTGKITYDEFKRALIGDLKKSAAM